MLILIKSLHAYQDLLKEIKTGQNISELRSGMGLPRSTRLPIISALQEDLQVPLILLTNRADRALTLFDELNFWLPDANRLYFPEPNPLFYEVNNWTQSTRRERLAVLTNLSKYHIPRGIKNSDKPPIIVAPIRSVMTRTIPRRNFLRNFQSLRISQQISIDDLIKFWLGIGYEASNIVVQEGQFSRRGGILDIWSSSSYYPVRIEFFGDLIDTLRHFNPATQRTVEPIDEFLVFPAKEILPVDADSINYSTNQLNEFHIPMVYKFPATMMDFIPEDSLILLDGQEFIQAAVNDIEEDAIQRKSDQIEAGIIKDNMPVPYITWSEIEDSFNQKIVLELGHSNVSNFRPLASSFDPGPRFTGRLKDFTQYLTDIDNQKNLWTVVSRQASRLRELWREIHPHYSQQELDCLFVEGSLSSGWVMNLPTVQKHYLLTDSEIFGWARPQPRRRFQPTAEAPESIYGDLEAGDLVVHVDHGIGRFIGLKKSSQGEVEREYLVIEYRDSDQLFVPIHQSDRITRYLGPGSEKPLISKLGGSEWILTKSKVSRAVQEVATDLLELYAQRKIAKGFAFNKDTAWQKELEASFPYIETEDQKRAIQEVKSDMESERPMDRLLCGDVGYGKTEVTLRAAFKAVMDGKQVAVLVPTTILAQQHYDTFRQRLEVFPVQVEMLSRFRKPKEQSTIIKRLASQEIDIIIGTHRLISDDVKFKDLGLVIIDEEQRFGVTHKEHLKKLRTSVDVLTLTATPIPRTLYMALTGARDISTINTPPEEKLPIVTHIGPYDQRLAREAIVREMERGGQIFFVHNRVQTIDAMFSHLSNLVPEARIGIGHGQMPEEALADVMHSFSDGQIDVLLCTSIIESGLDIPNANTLIIDRADTFGLAQLYQLRGRVGRGAQRAYAYLFRHNRRLPTNEGQERMEILAENTQLGSGYTIAMRDLEMRGAGELLGTRQSGYIASVGFHLYTKLLSQAVQEFRRALGETLAPSTLPNFDIPSMPISVDLPLSMGLPSQYIPDKDLRLTLYRRIANLRTEEDILATAIEFEDRFGPLPIEVENLLLQMKLKIRASRIGLESISIENDQLIFRYPPLPQGVTQRNLPIVDPRLRIGKNSYRTPLSLINDDTWQQFLLNSLLKIEKASLE